MLKSEFIPPKIFFTYIVVNWNCGDISNNVPKFRLLGPYDIRNIKHGRQKLNMMHYLIKNVYKDAKIVNIPNLVVRDWTPQKSIELYNSTKNMFMFSNIKASMSRRYKTIVLKAYYNMLIKRKG